MAVTFLEPGGDANFNVAADTAGGSWASVVGSPAIATDFVHGNHKKSIRIPPTNNSLFSRTGILLDSGSRISLYIYLVALPTNSGATAQLFTIRTIGATSNFSVRLTATGVLQLFNDSLGSQMGTDGSALSTGKWYRLCFAYTVTSGTVNEFRLFKDAVLDITLSNSPSVITASSRIIVGESTNDATLDFRFSDLYIDNSSSLTDTGDIWVTAKKPISNGTTNDFTTQVGSGGSGEGSGHSPQENERPASSTNGWSIAGAGSAVTEEYTVEAAGAGDMDISGKQIIDWLGWIYADALVGENASIIAGGASSSFVLPVASRVVYKVVGSTTYPAGGTDVGIITDTTVTTVRLYEAGVMIAFIGPPGSVVAQSNLLTLGVG